MVASLAHALSAARGEEAPANDTTPYVVRGRAFTVTATREPQEKKQPRSDSRKTALVTRFSPAKPPKNKVNRPAPAASGKPSGRKDRRRPRAQRAPTAPQVCGARLLLEAKSIVQVELSPGTIRLVPAKGSTKAQLVGTTNVRGKPVTLRIVGDKIESIDLSVASRLTGRLRFFEEELADGRRRSVIELRRTPGVPAKCGYALGRAPAERKVVGSVRIPDTGQSFLLFLLA